MAGLRIGLGDSGKAKKEDIRRNVAENISEERVIAMSAEQGGSAGGSQLNSDINVSIPKGLNPDEQGDITNERAVVVSIPFPGAYYIGRDPIAKDDLVETIKNRMKLRRPDEPQAVYIRGGISVPYGDVVDVINAVRDANFQQIGLVADKLKPGEK